MGGAVGELLDAWCRRHLGSPVVEQFFGVQRISSVHGVRLGDGREVALKVRGAEPRQAACTAVQARLWERGLPCPRPLAGPLPLSEPSLLSESAVLSGSAVLSESAVLSGSSVLSEIPVPSESDGAVDFAALAVNAETWEGEGVTAVGRGGAAAWGRLAARIVAAAPRPDELGTLRPPPPWLHWDHGDAHRTWPPAASFRWDPHRVEERIPSVVHETARRARARLLRSDVATLPAVVGHGDLEAQNCRWVGDRLIVHDWDSTVLAPEAVIAGNTALAYASVADDAIATIEQSEEAMAAYAAERGRRWTGLEAQVAWATGAWVGAYNAAFEHLKDGPGPVTTALVEQAAERLARAGA